MKEIPSFPEVCAEYARRLERYRAEKALYTRKDHTIGNQRLAVFGAGALMVWLVFGARSLSEVWLLVPLAVFLVLVFVHDPIIKRRERATRAVAYYEGCIERVEGRWAGRGTAGGRFAQASHPYADDLDLFGRGSLFELLCTARTRAGEDCLAEWLLQGAAPDAVRARQAAVEDLRLRLDLREDLAILGAEVRSSLDPIALADWGNDPLLLTSRRIRYAAFCLSALTAATLVLWGAGFGPIPFYALLVIGQVFDGFQQKRVRRVVKAADKPARDLGLLAEILARLERETFDSPLLNRLYADLTPSSSQQEKGGEKVERVSARIARLERLIGYLDARRNMLFAPLAFVLLWTTQFAYAVEAWRAENGPSLETWLRVVGEFEALGALSAYAYEHPEDPFPEITDEGVCFEAEGVAHPLLPTTQAVRNDIRIGPQARLFIVSGSNMSGKSTLLRTLGTNAVLALAGAPVRANRLRLTPLQIGASIRTQDSLQAGISRFYAEILRLRQIVEMAGGQPPLLFLLDEILHGTNSHDRRIGAEAVVRTLVARGAVGLVTTHDLALARIVEEEALHAANVHFEDQILDGKMSFDYHLRPGVVTKSNAIELMRAVGLEV